MVEPLIKPKRAAEILGCSDRHVRVMASRGEIPAMRIGNRWRFLESLLDEWRRQRLVSRCTPCPEPKEAIHL